MDLQLHGKSVIVTAASKGLGKAIAKEFAKEGAHVLMSSRNEAALQTAVREVKDSTGNQQVKDTLCDMTNATDIHRMVQTAVEWKGTVDVLINNAGGPPAGNFADMDDDDWYHAFELNLLSFIRTTREVLPCMQKQKSGRIVHLASSSIKRTLNNLVLSNTMRPGVLGLAKHLSQEYGKDNILINTVGPGTIATDRITELHAIQARKQGLTNEAFKKNAEENIPMKRFGRPEEFAKAVVFLGSGANSYITGQSLIIDGGLVKAL
ncbi:MAG TPA: SDR family oxidoreductase [Bacillota bacterium]